MPAYVGLDISQGEATGCFLLADGREPAPRWSAPNTQVGAGDLVLRLSALAHEHGIDELRIAMEATGLYWWHLACMLKDAPALQPYRVKIYAMNPKLVHDFRKNYGAQASSVPLPEVRMVTCLPPVALPSH